MNAKAAELLAAWDRGDVDAVRRALEDTEGWTAWISSFTMAHCWMLRTRTEKHRCSWRYALLVFRWRRTQSNASNVC